MLYNLKFDRKKLDKKTVRFAPAENNEQSPGTRPATTQHLHALQAENEGSAL